MITCTFFMVNDIHNYAYLQVQHLIERCLLLQMNRDQCIKALAEHAKIKPLVTLTGSSFVILT